MRREISSLCNVLFDLKPLVVKLQKYNQDIFIGYYMINTIISEFLLWHSFAVVMFNSIDVYD